MKYIYDGTFMGFLSTVHRVYHDGTSRMVSISSVRESADLFAGETEVATNAEYAGSVADAFLEKCGAAAFRWLYRAFLCDDDNEEYLFEYLRRGFYLKRKIYTCTGETWMREILVRSQKVGNEAEKFRGIVRFSELEAGMLYAAVRPTHNILPLIIGHFEKRLSSEEWAIHDLRRHIAAYYDKKSVSLVYVENPRVDMVYSSNEAGFRKLWRGYYRHMAIRERYNSAVQRSFLPKKYWLLLTEMNEDK